MAEIFIDRCTFRVVRRRGWSWGPDPERWIEHALKRLPNLLAAKLEGFFPDDAENVYEAPLRISIKLPPAAFDEQVSSSSLKSFSSVSFGSASFDERLQNALRAALEKLLMFPTESASPPSWEPSRFPLADVESQGPLPQGEPLQRFLLALVKKKELEHFLGSFAVQELEVWHAALRRVPGCSGGIQEERAVPILAELEAAFSSHKASHITDRATLLRVRLILATEVAAKLRLPLTDLILWLALDELLPLSEPTQSRGYEPLPSINEPRAPTLVVPANAVESRSLANSPPAAPSHLCASASSDPKAWSTRVHSALPFLLLAPLHRIGYFSTLGAVLDAAHLADRANLFAVALAYKVLDRLERGWRRSSSVQHAAGVFAGSSRPLPDEALHEFSRLIAAHTGPLDRWLTDSVNSGRDKASPVLLHRAESENLSGFLFFDPPGCFPLAWVDDTSAAVSWLENIESPVVLVSSEASGPRVLRELDQGGITFVTQVPPIRGENWRQVFQGTSHLAWTNHVGPHAEFIVRSARMLEIASLEAASFWEQFGIARPAVPRAKLPALEHSVTFAASIALGILAWQLWKERGRTTPQLALERLGDFDASVRFSGQTLQVGLPRGRRHSELLEAGLLAVVRDIPWLRGCQLEFGLG